MSTNKLDIGGDTSSEEDEDAPIGITAPVSSSSSSSSSSADSKASNQEPPEKVIQVTKAHSAALQAAINAASAESESVLINYAAQASDLPELAHAENLVYREPYNTRAWETICGQAQSLPLDRARPLYERFLRKFPTAGRYWKYYAEHEYREGETSKADAVFERGLVNTVSSELWRCYTDFKRNVYTEEKDAHLVDVAYQRALDEIGSSFDSLGIWKDYIGWITSRLEAVNANDQFEQGKLQNKLREIYKKSIKLPIRGIGELWSDYETFERSLVQESNRILAERILKDNEPIAKNMIAVAKERGKLYDGIDMNMLASPCETGSSNTTGTNLSMLQLVQLSKWRDVIKWEKEQEANSSTSSIRLRVRHTYKQALCVLRFFPELWYEFSMEELNARDVESALLVLATGCRVLNTDKKGCLILQFARASLLERLKRIKEASDVWNTLTKEKPCPLIHIQHMRFARRTDSVKAARKVFAKARKQYESTCTWRVYVAAALLEFYSNNNTKVAGNIFELGLKRFPDCVPFITQYVKFLSGLNDEAPLRVLFQRVIGSQMNEEKPELTRSLWLQYLAFENSMAVDGGDVEASEQLERRFFDKYKQDDDPYAVPTGLCLQAYRFSFLDLHPDTPSDQALLAREKYYQHEMISGPLTFEKGLNSGGGGGGSSSSSSSSSSGSNDEKSSSDSFYSSSSRSKHRSRSKSPMGRGRSRSQSRGRTSSRPAFIMPSFLAPLMYYLPDDDDNVYWPTKNHDIKNVIASFQNAVLPPPPTEEECQRIEKIRNQRYNASWKDEIITAVDGNKSGEKDGSDDDGNNDDKKIGSGKRKRDDEKETTEDTPRVKSRKSSKASSDIYTQRMRDKQSVSLR